MIKLAVIWVVLVLVVVAGPVSALTVNTGSLLRAENDYSMQPFGVGAEDDDTAALYVQGTAAPVATWNGIFIQGALNE